MNDQPEQQALPPILVTAQYVKDLSFEAPGAPAIYADMANATPDIAVQVDLTVQGLQEPLFEVTLKIGVNATLPDGKVAFIVDLTYAGIFAISVPEEHRQPVLLVECPRLLFPFARNIVADVIRDGNFPPLLLQPIDFVALYRSRLEQGAIETVPPPNGGITVN